MPETKLNPIKHLHWKKLIDHKDMPEIADNHAVFMIVIKPHSSTELIGGEKKECDLVAYLHGVGSDYLGKFIHTTSCDWVKVSV